MSKVFLDTSIQIARMVHGPETKRRINERLSRYSGTVTSLIVRQEFKRRLLPEAHYLLNQLNDKKSFAKVQRHVQEVLHQPRWKRKREICLATLQTIFEKHGDRASDAELTERAIRYLRTFLRVGGAVEMEPCLTVGDLMIAMESTGVPVFYTLNSKESQHLCRALKQTLVVRPKNPEHEDLVCLDTDGVWPEF